MRMQLNRPAHARESIRAGTTAGQLDRKFLLSSSMCHYFLNTHLKRFRRYKPLKNVTAGPGRVGPWPGRYISLRIWVLH